MVGAILKAHASVSAVFEKEWGLLDPRGLPFHYESISAVRGQRPIGFRYSNYIVNIIASYKGHEIIACGEAESQEVAEAKAYSELIERSMLILHGAETSNGWAAHPTEDGAKTNAILELVERDAVLAHWFSSTPFREIEASSFPAEIKVWTELELARSEFPILRVLLSTLGLGPSVTCLLVNEKGFGVVAHSCRLSLLESISSAIAEACRAAHSTLRREYWKDSLKLAKREPGFVNPGTHAVYHAYHESYPVWMFGDKLTSNEAQEDWSVKMGNFLSKLDEFNFIRVLESPLYVGFAEHPKAFDLHWRQISHDEIIHSKAWARLDLKPEAINADPHIVS